MSNYDAVRTMHTDSAEIAEQVKQLSDDLFWLSNFNADYDPATYEDARRKIGAGLINALGKVNALPTIERKTRIPAVVEDRNRCLDYPTITPDTRFLGYSPEEVDMLMKRAGIR